MVLITVPDDAIASVAAGLAGSGKITERQVVLHVSGVLDRSALQPLASSGAALGSMHPLQSISDPASAPERLQGAYAAVEGDDRAVTAASELARAVGLHPLRLAPGQKARYHAGAVFAANFLVALYGEAEKLFVQAGVGPADAAPALLALMRGVLENLRARGARGALTGPVARGDVESIRHHLAALDGLDAELYRALSRAALELATLDEEKRRAVMNLLRQSGTEAER